MDDQNFSTVLLVNETPGEVYNAINNVRGWWSEGIEGTTDTLYEQFTYWHGDLHYSKQKLVELIANEKVVWLVTDSRLTFVTDQSAWTGTTIHFEISKQGKKTQILFTHMGLIPRIECYRDCAKGWNYYLHNSLLKLITTGKGCPDPKQAMAV